MVKIAGTQHISQPAGFWVRLLANILDFVIIGVPLLLIGYLLTGTWQGNFWINLLSFLYSILLPIYWFGYTVGKRILGVRIVKVDGEKVGFGTMLLRTLVSGIIYGITLGIGIIVSAFMIAFRKDKRAIHDFIAGTYVSYQRP